MALQIEELIFVQKLIIYIMLQRIQTVWLFFATVALFGLFLFPCVQVLNSSNGAAKVIKVNGVYESINGQIVQTQEFILLMIATVIVGLLPFITIFFYQNHKKQIIFCYLTILFILGHSFWLARMVKQVVDYSAIEIGNYSIGMILPSLSILFVILALRGIRRDEKLLKSAERLR